MTTVQMPGEEAYDSQMAMHTSTENTYISLAREFQKRLSDPTRSHGLLRCGKDRKRSIKRNWTEHEYHFQDRKCVSHISVQMSCATTQLPALSFCGSYAKPRGVRRLSKHYHFRIDPKLDHGKFSIR